MFKASEDGSHSGVTDDYGSRLNLGDKFAGLQKLCKSYVFWPVAGLTDLSKDIDFRVICGPIVDYLDHAIEVLVGAYGYKNPKGFLIANL